MTLGKTRHTEKRRGRGTGEDLNGGGAESADSLRSIQWWKGETEGRGHLDAGADTGDNASRMQQSFKEPGGRRHGGTGHAVLQCLDQSQTCQQGNDAGGDHQRRRQVHANLVRKAIGHASRNHRDEATDEVLEEHRQRLRRQPCVDEHRENGGERGHDSYGPSTAQQQCNSTSEESPRAQGVTVAVGKRGDLDLEENLLRLFQLHTTANDGTDEPIHLGKPREVRG